MLQLREFVREGAQGLADKFTPSEWAALGVDPPDNTDPEFELLHELLTKYVQRRAPDVPTAIANTCLVRLATVLNPDRYQRLQPGERQASYAAMWRTSGCALLCAPYFHHRAAVLGVQLAVSTLPATDWRALLAAFGDGGNVEQIRNLLFITRALPDGAKELSTAELLGFSSFGGSPGQRH